VPLRLKAGEVSLHDDRAVHGSPANPSARRRAGLTIRYSATEVKNDLSVNPHFKTFLCRGVDTYRHNPAGTPPSERFARPDFKAVSVEEAGAEAEARLRRGDDAFADGSTRGDGAATEKGTPLA
jgi:hypothetical protein